MGVHHDGLGLGVADDADADVAGHFREILGEFGAEMGVLDVVNVLVRLTVVEGCHAGTLGAKVRMIIRSVEQIGDTGSFGNDAKETTHNVFLFLNDNINILITITL